MMPSPLPYVHPQVALARELLRQDQIAISAKQVKKILMNTLIPECRLLVLLDFVDIMHERFHPRCHRFQL